MLPMVTALSAAGELLDTSGGKFTFVGFLPPKAGQRDAAIRQWAAHEPAWVLYEAPHRIDATLAALAEHLPARRLLIGRELTKLHQELLRGTVAELHASIVEPLRGEVTVVVDRASVPPQVHERASARAVPEKD